MDDFNAPARLRNACDACHKLKRRCTGAMPCENCAALGTSCAYSVAGRQGRPRGSRSRRNNSASGHSNDVNGISSRPWPTAVSKTGPAPPIPRPPPPLIQSNDPATFDTMLDLGFDPVLSYSLSLSGGQDTSEDSTLVRLYPTPERDSLAGFDSLPMLGSSSLSGSTSGNVTPLSAAAMEIEQQQQPNQRRTQGHEHAHVTSQRTEIPLPDFLYQTHANGRQSGPSRSSPPPDCDCIPRLSALLHDIRRPASDTLPPAGLDDVLSRVSNALTQWSLVAACQRCQDHESQVDDGETLLLAAMSMRRVVAQLKEGGFWLGPANCGRGEDADEVELRIGAFHVTGSDRATLLNVLRTITVRKLDAAVKTMQCSLRTKRERHGEGQSAVLHHVESILADLAKMVKS